MTVISVIYFDKILYVFVLASYKATVIHLNLQFILLVIGVIDLIVSERIHNFGSFSIITKIQINKDIARHNNFGFCFVQG